MKRTKNSKFKAMVGKRIRLARVAAKMKAKDLASFVGVTPSAVCQYEKGKTEPDLETFRAICESTETSADAVLGIKRDTKTVSNDR